GRSVGRAARADLQHRVVELEAGLVADVEGRMGIEYLEPRKQQEEQADRPDPMGDARCQRLPIDEWSCARARRGPFDQLVHRRAGVARHALLLSLSFWASVRAKSRHACAGGFSSCFTIG